MYIVSSVTSIGLGAFSSCNNLKRITIPFVGKTLNGKDNIHFGYIFGASSYYSQYRCVPETLKEVIITGGTSIGNYAFYGCLYLTSIIISNSVTSIGSYSFHSCTSLMSILIPASVTSIDNYAFNWCFSLTIYCEVDRQPYSWSYNWNPEDRPVIWGYTL